MVGESLWKNLKVLVEHDKELVNIATDIKKTKKLLKDYQDAIPKLEAFLEECKLSWQKEKKNVDLEELNAKDLKEKQKSKQELLNKTASSKEYKAVEREIKLLTSQEIELEDTLIKAWHKLESSKKTLDVEKENTEKKTLQLKEGIEAQKKALEDLTASEVERKEKRQQATEVIPKEWLTKYERMKHKVSNPIVPVVGSSCSACYYSILRHDLQKLKKGGVVPCRSCYRFLYYDLQEEKDDKKETF